MSVAYIPQAPGSTALDAGEWFAHATRLEVENAELRRIATVLLFWITRREHIYADAIERLEQRWPLNEAA